MKNLASYGKKLHTLIVRLINNLSHPTGIHWHGIELENYADWTPVTQNGVLGAPLQVLVKIRGQIEPKQTSLNFTCITLLISTNCICPLYLQPNLHQSINPIQTPNSIDQFIRLIQRKTKQFDIRNIFSQRD